MRSVVVSMFCAVLSLSACSQGSGPAAELATGASALSRPGAVSPEIDLEPPVYLPDPRGNEPADAVFNGQDWVATMGSSRLTRITPEGVVRDPLGVAAPAGMDKAALATDGSLTAVVWSERGNQDESAWFRLFDRDLAPLGTALRIQQTTDDSLRVGVAFGAGQYLVAIKQSYDVWNSSSSTLTLYHRVSVVRVSAAGALIDATPIQLSHGLGHSWEPRVSWDGTRFLVVWEVAEQNSTRSRVLGVRVTADGVPIDGGVVLAENARYPALCTAGGVHTLVWSTTPTWNQGTPADTFAVRLSPGLARLDEQPLQIASGAGNQYDADCATLGDTTLISWANDGQGSQVEARFLSQAGVLSEPFALKQASSGGWPIVLASAGQQALALWNDGGTRVSAAGELLDGSGVVIGQTTAHQTGAMIASSSENALVAFNDSRPGNNRSSIRVQRVSHDGAPLDPQAMSLVESSGNSNFVSAIASDDHGYVVIFDQQGTGKSRVVSAHVALDGRIDAPVVIAESEFDMGSLQVAGSTDGYLVTWGSNDVWGRFLRSDGGLQGPVFPISAAPGGQGMARVAFDGEHYLAMWQDWRSGEPALRATRISVAEGVLDVLGREIAHGPAVDANGTLAMATGAGGAYAVWSRWEGSAYRMYGIWFDPAGEEASSEARELSGMGTFPAIAFDGGGFTVLGLTDGTSFATRVSERGEPAGGRTLIVADAHRGLQSIAVTPAGEALIAYVRQGASDDGPRARLRVLGGRDADVTYDAGTPEPHVDAGVPGQPDAGVDPEPDASVAPQDDGGVVVDPEPDGGMVLEPIVEDGGLEPDAGSVDAWPSEDASIVEPAPQPDAAVEMPEPQPDPDTETDQDPATASDSAHDGCSCSVSSPAPRLDRGFLLLLLAGYLVRRRRGARPAA